MNESTISEAKRIAQEFVNRANLVLKLESNDPTFHLEFGAKETAALRRTSMELTRALSRMRKPG